MQVVHVVDALMGCHGSSQFGGVDSGRCSLKQDAGCSADQPHPGPQDQPGNHERHCGIFLTSVGIVIGISLTWLNDPTRSTDSDVSNSPATKSELPMLSADEKVVVNVLSSNGGSMWQAEVVKASGFTNSKASRLLSRMEHSGLIRRVRDGMGKRIELTVGGE